MLLRRTEEEGSGRRHDRGLRFLHVYCRNSGQNTVASTGQERDENHGLPAGLERLAGREKPTARYPGVCTAGAPRDWRVYGSADLIAAFTQGTPARCPPGASGARRYPHRQRMKSHGPSVGEIITTVDTLVKQRMRLIAIKEGMHL